MYDEKGKLIGLAYDYEYRGWKRERNRDMPLWKRVAVYAIIGLFFAVVGIFGLIESPSEVVVILFCFLMAALMGWLIRLQHKKHSQLLELIKRFK